MALWVLRALVAAVALVYTTDFDGCARAVLAGYAVLPAFILVMMKTVAWIVWLQEDPC